MAVELSEHEKKSLVIARNQRCRAMKVYMLSVFDLNLPASPGDDKDPCDLANPSIKRVFRKKTDVSKAAKMMKKKHPDYYIRILQGRMS